MIELVLDPKFIEKITITTLEFNFQMMPRNKSNVLLETNKGNTLADLNRKHIGFIHLFGTGNQANNISIIVGWMKFQRDTIDEPVKYKMKRLYIAGPL